MLNRSSQSFTYIFKNFQVIMPSVDPPIILLGNALCSGKLYVYTLIQGNYSTLAMKTKRIFPEIL